MTASLLRYLLFIVVPLLDVATILLVAEYTGALLALLIVVISSMTGLALCLRYARRIKARSDDLKRQYLGDAPPDLQLIDAYDAFTNLILMFLFIYPGFISDIVAFFLVLPRLQSKFYEAFVRGLRETARKQGKSLEEYLTPKCDYNKKG